MKKSDIRRIVREELNRKLDEFVSHQLQKGATKKTDNDGIGAKNRNEVTRYFYGTDAKQKAETFKKDNSKQPDK